MERLDLPSHCVPVDFFRWHRLLSAPAVCDELPLQRGAIGRCATLLGVDDHNSSGGFFSDSRKHDDAPVSDPEGFQTDGKLEGSSWLCEARWRAPNCFSANWDARKPRIVPEVDAKIAGREPNVRQYVLSDPDALALVRRSGAPLIAFAEAMKRSSNLEAKCPTETLHVDAPSTLPTPVSLASDAR